MNLENLNLVELNAQEVSNIDGGDYPGYSFFLGVKDGFCSSCLQIAGALAGIGDGIRAGMK
ncbi:hypothetical protein [Flavobacterium croceum]|uniref:Uncharacterized protein n=1 Tax=Flavobacterium croceum DSM 17960 TaxID=1121886 RepID=A0A2S4N5K7_9FLAO|nr:hypothetical protein [Flavobacterium croceum]POS01009.1 hypothetical protein Q361_11515 [Flavobacterium croceum DSM 17960]